MLCRAVPAVLASGESWRLFTSLLLHGGITHLALDTLFLGFMGPGEQSSGNYQLSVQNEMQDLDEHCVVMW